MFEFGAVRGLSRPAERNEHTSSLSAGLLTLVPALAISSTDCRQRAEQTGPLVPDAGRSCSMPPRRLTVALRRGRALTTSLPAAGNGP